MTNKSKYVWLIQRSKLPLTVRPGLTRPFRLLMNLTARFCIISTLIMLVLVCGSQTTSAYSSTGLVTNPLFIFISCCYNCQKSLPRLHDPCKHERVYRHLMSCQHCHAQFSTAEAERAHIQEKHCMLIGRQTEYQKGVVSIHRGLSTGLYLALI